MSELQKKLDLFLRSTRTNPPQAAAFEFLEVLSEEGQLFDYSEQDWIEAGKSLNMNDNEIAVWVETAASWIEDTTDEGKYDPEPSFWSNSR
jgi:hypothetical protein